MSSCGRYWYLVWQVRESSIPCKVMTPNQKEIDLFPVAIAFWPLPTILRLARQEAFRDTRIIEAQRIKALMRDFGFVGETAGPQERSCNNMLQVLHIDSSHSPISTSVHFRIQTTTFTERHISHTAMHCYPPL